VTTLLDGKSGLIRRVGRIRGPDLAPASCVVWTPEALLKAGAHPYPSSPTSIHPRPPFPPTCVRLQPPRCPLNGLVVLTRCLCVPVRACACLCVPMRACACLCVPVHACVCACLCVQVAEQRWYVHQGLGVLVSEIDLHSHATTPLIVRLAPPVSAPPAGWLPMSWANNTVRSP